MTHASINYCKILITFFHPLILSQILKLEQFCLHIFKDFDKVWHEKSISKLQSVGILSSFFNLMKRFLGARYQKVPLTGQTLKWGKYQSKSCF